MAPRGPFGEALRMTLAILQASPRLPHKSVKVDTADLCRFNADRWNMILIDSADFLFVGR